MFQIGLSVFVLSHRLLIALRLVAGMPFPRFSYVENKQMINVHQLVDSAILFPFIVTGGEHVSHLIVRRLRCAAQELVEVR